MKFSKRSASPSPLRGRALVTGGTSGIGLAFARALAARGCDIALVARNEARLESVAAELSSRGVDVVALSADLSQAEGVAKVCSYIDEEQVEILVNNAGKGLHHPLATTDTAPLREAIDLMATAVVEVGAVAAAAMKARGHGVVVNTASVSGLVPMGLYSAIKALVKTWSQALALEMRPHGVQVVTFMPGWVRTEHHARAGIATSNLPDAVWLDADAVVEETLRAVDAGKTYVTPSLKFKVASALARYAPQRAVGAVTQKIVRRRDG